MENLENSAQIACPERRDKHTQGLICQGKAALDSLRAICTLGRRGNGNCRSPRALAATPALMEISPEVLPSPWEFIHMPPFRGL
jgi:hypothetical protein